MDDDGSESPTAQGPATTSTRGSTTSSTRGPLGSGAAITIAFAGDMNFEGALRNRLDADPSTAVGPFAEVLSGADLAIGNLETAIATGGTRADKRFTFRAPANAIDALRAGGFDAVSMANNHGMDFGAGGLAETLAVKRAQADGFVIGIGGDEDEAFAPFRAEVRGQRVAVIAATQVLDDNLIDSWTATDTQSGLASAKRVDRLVAEVRAARATSDTVVVFLHWGRETETCPTSNQQALAQALVDAGADAVVGGHAHRLQGGGRLGGAFVHYGLGNFLFKENSAEGARTGVLELTITGRQVDGYRWIPGRISGSVPRPLAGTDATSELSYWESLRGCADGSLAARSEPGSPTRAETPAEASPAPKAPATGAGNKSAEPCSDDRVEEGLGGTAERLGRHAELAVVPGAGAGGADPHGDPLVEHELHEGLDLLGVRAVVALPHAHADGPQRVRVVDDLGGPLELDPAQRVVGVPRLDERADAVVASRFTTFCDFALVSNHTSPSTTAYHMATRCGMPVGPMVAMLATRCSSRNCATSASVNVI